MAGEIDLVHQPRFLLRQGRNVLQDGDGSIIHKVARSRHSRRFIENTWMLLEFRKYIEIVIDFFFLSFFLYLFSWSACFGGREQEMISKENDAFILNPANLADAPLGIDTLNSVFIVELFLYLALLSFFAIPGIFRTKFL